MNYSRDFTGMRFHKLVAVRPTGKVTNSRNRIWELICDNRKCVNVSHLFVGTQSDNIKDAWVKGRGRAPWQSR